MALFELKNERKWLKAVLHGNPKFAFVIPIHG